MDGILFNNIPATGLTAPLMSFEVNSGGQYDAADRFIVIGHMTAGWPGNLSLLTPTPVYSQDQADAMAGPGSQLREMYRIASANAPGEPIWLLAVAEPGTTKAAWTLTVGPLTGIGVGSVVINGEQIDVPITATDTPATIAFFLASAIAGYYQPLTKAMLPLTATNAAAVVTATARHAGAIFGETDFFIPNTPGNLFTGMLTIASSQAGTGNPVVAAALNALGDDPADYVVCPWSDPVSLASYVAWASDVSGRWAWSRQTYGVTWTAYSGSFAALTTLGLSLNDRHTTVMPRITGGPNGNPIPSYLWCAAVAARLAPWLSDCDTGNVSRNHTGLVLEGILPPRDRSVWPNYNGRNTLNNSGISTWKVGADGSVQIDKVVTTYRNGTSGQPDSVFRDIQSMYQVSGGLKKMRADLAYAHGNKAVAETNPGSLAAISTPSDIKATFIHSYTGLCESGVFSDPDTYAQKVQVKIDKQNTARVNVFNPMERVSPLDVLAANATIYQRFPEAA